MVSRKKPGYRKYKWRIYADANAEAETIKALRNAGTDVLWVTEKPQLRKHKEDRYFHTNRARGRPSLSHGRTGGLPRGTVDQMGPGSPRGGPASHTAEGGSIGP